MRYYSGHVDRFWNEDFKNLQYIRQPITEEEKESWISLGYNYVKSFTGMMYDSKNSLPLWVNKFNTMFGLKNQTYTFYKMQTLEIMPPHVDHFRSYIKLFNSVPENVCRVLVMLEDWKPGHYLEINNEGYVNWKEGDYFFWRHDVIHAASNIGIDPRYTLQITGELNG